MGYTAIDVDKRVAQQYPTKRPDGSVPYRIVYRESAMYPDGSSFTDHDVHRILKRKQITGMGGEWFRCTVNDVRAAVLAVKTILPMWRTGSIAFHAPGTAGSREQNRRLFSECL